MLLNGKVSQQRTTMPRTPTHENEYVILGEIFKYLPDARVEVLGLGIKERAGLVILLCFTAQRSMEDESPHQGCLFLFYEEYFAPFLYLLSAPSQS